MGIHGDIYIYRVGQKKMEHSFLDRNFYNFYTDVIIFCTWYHMVIWGMVYWGLTPQQQPRSYQGGEMMMMKSVIWWRKPEYPEETTDLRQVTDETFSHIRPLPSPGVELGLQRCEAK